MLSTFLSHPPKKAKEKKIQIPRQWVEEGNLPLWILLMGCVTPSCPPGIRAGKREKGVSEGHHLLYMGIIILTFLFPYTIHTTYHTHHATTYHIHTMCTYHSYHTYHTYTAHTVPSHSTNIPHAHHVAHTHSMHTTYTHTHTPCRPYNPHTPHTIPPLPHTTHIQHATS